MRGAQAPAPARSKRRCLTHRLKWPRLSPALRSIEGGRTSSCRSADQTQMLRTCVQAKDRPGEPKDTLPADQPVTRAPLSPKTRTHRRKHAHKKSKHAQSMCNTNSVFTLFNTCLDFALYRFNTCCLHFHKQKFPETEIFRNRIFRN